MKKHNFTKKMIAGLLIATAINLFGAAGFCADKKLSPMILPDSAFSNLNGAAAPVEKPKLPKKKVEIYTDEQGHPISKEQKERSEQLKKTYKKVTKEERIMETLELMKGGLADFSRNAILGNNLTNEPIFITFDDLSKFGQAYANFDALGWKKKDRLYIYINKKHQDAPTPALAAVLAHEALHQDEFNSLNEETYAWTLEAAVWTQLSEKDPKYNDSMHPLVIRENTLKKLFIKGNYTNKYIRKTVYQNPGYSNLPSRSPGFEDDNL